VAVDIFLVIRPNSQNPQVSDTLTTDPYFASTFSGAVVFEVSDFDFDVQTTINLGAAVGVPAAGKASFGQLVIHRAVDKLSPALLSVSATGEHFAAIQLYLRHPNPTAGGAVPAPFLAYEFQTVFISKIEWSAGAAGADLTEEVTFVYGALAVAFQAVNADGTTAGTVVKSGWSQLQNSSSVQDSIILS
jgi:type VI protein secretion system component Hcp